MSLFWALGEENSSTRFMTMVNFISSPPSGMLTIKDVALKQLRVSKADAGPRTERIVDNILAEIFAERRGNFTETSSSCDEVQVGFVEQHVDQRLRYWQTMLEARRAMQQRVELQTGKSPEQVLFNRRATLENRDKEMVRRIMDYADRMRPEQRASKPMGRLAERIDPCTCNVLEAINETLPQAEARGETSVEVSGLPAVIRQELLGEKAAGRELQHVWQQSPVLEKRLEEQFEDIAKVVEFMPDLEKLQVTGVSVAKLKVPPSTQLLKAEDTLSVSPGTTDLLCDEEQRMSFEFSTGSLLECSEPNPEPPELAIKVNGKDYIVDEKPITECLDTLIKFQAEPYERRLAHILHLKNIGKQTLSFNWIQGVFYHNRASLRLAGDNEFLFDTESFRLARGESVDLFCLYQPRKVAVAVEMWRLMVDPCIFCSDKESIRIRLHGRCTPPAVYVDKLNELSCGTLDRVNRDVMGELAGHLAELVPLVVPPPACCPYERTLYEREQFNSSNPGYNCERFDDLEALKSFHVLIKKPRDRPWDLRIDTLKAIIMTKNVADREDLFLQLMVLLEPLAGPVARQEISSQLNKQQQLTRFIYVRGVIANGIEEWENQMIIIEESFYKSEWVRYMRQMEQVAEEQDEEEVLEPKTAALLAKLSDKILRMSAMDIQPKEMRRHLELEVELAITQKVRHSKYLHDSLYIHTYSHLCDIAETIASVIESTNLVAD